MNRFPKIIIGCMTMLMLCAVFVGAILFALSGGQPINYVQTGIIRLSLLSRTEELNTPAGSSDTLVRFTVNSGDSPTTVAQNLQAVGLVSDVGLFVNYLRAENLDTQLQASTYFLTQTQTIPDIARTIIDSRNSSITFRVLEGWRLEEIAAAIDADLRFGFRGTDFLGATFYADSSFAPAYVQTLGIAAGETLEGFMYPDTYSLPPDIDAATLRDTLAQAFMGAVGNQWFIDAQTQGFTPQEAVTLASIVERESVFPDEDPLIAGVYRNRLLQPMLLQADPTVQYPLGNSRGTWWAQITLADYQGVISPFNTYLNAGLPPAPIANPSLSALRAALYPQASPYIFFRARCDGSNRHVFAVTYAEHLANGC